jgi:hypothetical protein
MPTGETSDLQIGRARAHFKNRAKRSVALGSGGCSTAPMARDRRRARREKQAPRWITQRLPPRHLPTCRLLATTRTATILCITESLQRRHGPLKLGRLSRKCLCRAHRDAASSRRAAASTKLCLHLLNPHRVRATSSCSACHMSRQRTTCC